MYNVKFDIKEELKKLPDKPGVYLMKDVNDTIIYVGKAIVLKNRVRQYFQNSKNHTPKVRRMVSNIVSFEYIITDSELEALILECNLIKKYRPKYNVLLKDDKHYPYIKITMNEKYPRILIVRKIEKDGCKYFGPYVNSWAVNETVDTIKRLFPIKTCNRVFPRDIGKERPCLNYHIKRCIGPCLGTITSEDYKKLMNQIVDFLSGRHEDIIKQLQKKMYEASESMDFELAANYRDRIDGIKKVIQKQKIISSAMEDEDIIAFATDREKACVQIFFVRGGKLIGRESFILDDSRDEVQKPDDGSNEGVENNEGSTNKEEILASFIKQFYTQTEFVPKEIVIQNDITEAAIIESWLSNKRGSKVTLKAPKKGDKKELVEMVFKNAMLTLNNFAQSITEREDVAARGLNQLLEQLNINFKSQNNKKRDIRIEAFDISNISGFDSVGAMVVFVDGLPVKSYYRRFKIKEVVGANDYESMKEVLRRRFRNAFEEQQKLDESKIDITQTKFAILPDIIMMDGGDIQIKAAKEVLLEYNLDIPVVGMVKDNNHKTRGVIYNAQEYRIDLESEAFRLVYTIQEEVHRFAIEYHRNLRKKGMTKSILDKIEGIGVNRRNNLLKSFGSVDRIREAKVEDLIKVDGITQKAAENVYNFFHEI